MSERTDDPSDSPYLHQVLYTNDLARIISTWISGLFTVAEPERVRAALQSVLDSWPRHLEVFETMQRLAQRLDDEGGNAPPVPKGGGN